MLPIKRDPLRQRVVRYLFEAIVKGEFKPGERVVEGKLARQLGVAQSTLREALQELEHQGLVTKYANRGTFVTEISLEEINQLYTVRMQLEPLAAALVRERITPEDYAQLAALLETMRNAGERRDLVELAQADLEFHQMIWRLSGNRWLERALRLVGPPILALDYVGLYSAPTYDFARAHQQHQGLLNALNTGTPEDAKRFYEKTLEVFRLQDIANLQALQAAPTGPELARAGNARALSQSR